MKVSVHVLVLVALVAGAYVAGYRLTNPKTCGAFCGPQIQSVHAREFNTLLAKNSYTIIDVRTPQEFMDGHIEHAVNANIKDSSLFDQFLTSLDIHGKYLVYCRSGNRSGQALERMKQKGFTNVTDLSGGILAWQKEGYALVKSK